MAKKTVVLLLTLLMSVTFAVVHDLSPEDKAEWSEWSEFVERLKLINAAKNNDLLLLNAPDTEWLKTCSGWTAQELCSTIFGSGLSEQTAYEEDLGYIPRAFTDYWIDYQEKSVVASCTYNNPLNQTYKSIWREGIGCTLVERLSEEEIRAQDLGNQTPPAALDPNVPWPEGEGFFPERVPRNVDVDCIDRIADQDFGDPLLNPRAYVIVYQGQLVYERYKPGVTKDNRLLGWSATKSVTQALVGILVKDGLLDIYKPAQIAEWYEQEGDARQNITVDMMLRMSSGTRWVGDIGPTTECIFWSNADCAHACGLKPLVNQPDTVWNYNSGSTYLLSRLISETRGESRLTNFEWPKRRLFYPIGAHSFYIEYQPNEHFLGGAYGYATARDWARFGLLYARDGVWIDGTRILPEGWVSYSSTPTHTNQEYAAHFWRQSSVDSSMFFASGFRNQNVYIFPRQQMVIVRLAMPPLAAHPLFQSHQFLTDMLSCFNGEKNN